VGRPALLDSPSDLNIFVGRPALLDSASILLYFGASQTGGILLYVEDLKRGTNPAKGGRPKDIFEMGSYKLW
jgi:hypothetical protein